MVKEIKIEDFEKERVITFQRITKSVEKARNTELKELQNSSRINSLIESLIEIGITKRMGKMIICFIYAKSRSLGKPLDEFRLIINSNCNFQYFIRRKNFGF
ncbi:MAG: hypothetical protein NTY74_11805 [Ignavibacteriae bacterium]|nr:hypothetical protein [Ignavibacteriota bacterium]